MMTQLRNVIMFLLIMSTLTFVVNMMVLNKVSNAVELYVSTIKTPLVCYKVDTLYRKGFITPDLKLAETMVKRGHTITETPCS
ncbi:TMhelix containing protein [Vibrio phage 1.055.O._10N.286.55.E9]|nr:TMhelix containing protein [Vibrio phage 1.055.O._10N.286.55.E9]